MRADQRLGRSCYFRVAPFTRRHGYWIGKETKEWLLSCKPPPPPSAGECGCPEFTFEQEIVFIVPVAHDREDQRRPLRPRRKTQSCGRGIECPMRRVGWKNKMKWGGKRQCASSGCHIELTAGRASSVLCRRGGVPVLTHKHTNTDHTDHTGAPNSTISLGLHPAASEVKKKKIVLIK